MKIVHLCLSNYYVDNYSYQENELVGQNVKDGHEVTVVASTETIGSDSKITYLQPGDYIGGDGARVIRIPYRDLVFKNVSRKVRAFPGVSMLLEQLKPDVMLFHGTCSWELSNVARYASTTNNVKLFVDSHEDFNNSARNFLSKWFLHYSLYRPVLLRSLKAIEKVLCVNLDSMQFLREFYGVPGDKLEFYPLGGQVYSDSQYVKTRKAARLELHLAASAIVFLQSGKMDSSKKLVDSLRAFGKISNPQAVFLVVGRVAEDISEDVRRCMEQDSRIFSLGWKRPEELRQLLCAADYYVQPGTQSATMQMALCSRCAIILDDIDGHNVYHRGNGWLVGKGVTLEQSFVLACCARDSIDLMSRNSAIIAEQILDYRSLASRLYGGSTNTFDSSQARC
jgi:1,2-diacylglycerol 3-alpha-glucosyltransferase